MTCFLKRCVLKITVTAFEINIMGCLCAIYYCVCCDDFFFCRYNTMWVLLIYICMCCLMTRALILSASGMVFHEIRAIL